MDKIVHRLKAYIDTHPFNPDDSDCELFWISFIKPTQNPTNPTRRRLATASKNWKNSYAYFPWKITTPSLTSAAAFAVPTNTKPLLMVSNTEHI